MQLVKKITTLTLLFFLSIASNSNAEMANKNFLIQYQKELNEIENYLQNIKYLRANFLQISPDKNVVEGKFYLVRPGKMRIEYNGPSKILVIVNGNILAYQDLELEETSYLATSKTPASFLTRNNISFTAKDVEITDFIKEKNFIKVSVRKKNNKEAGEFSLIFTTDPIKFSKMEIKNDLDETTLVTLFEVKLEEKIDNNLFIIKDNKIPK